MPSSPRSPNGEALHEQGGETIVGSEPHTLGIDHVALAVRNASEVADWYCRTLGSVVIQDELIPDPVNVRLVFLSFPGTGGPALQLVEPTGVGAVQDHVNARGDGLHHVCFAVGDLDETLAHLGGYAGPTFIGGFGLRCSFLQGTLPGGAMIELVEKTPRVADRLRESPSK